MKQPLEQHLTEVLEARATTVRDLPDLGERVVTRGRRVRRRRRVYGGLAVVVAVATAVATPTLLVDPDARRTPAPPVTTPTSTPSPSRSEDPVSGRQQQRQFLDTAAVGPPTSVPFAVGRRLFIGDQRITVRLENEIVTQVHQVVGGYLVRVGRPFSAGATGLIREGSYQELAPPPTGRGAVDPSRRLAVWPVHEGGTRAPRTRLTLVQLPSGSRVSEQVITGGPWNVVGYADNGIVISRYGQPGGSRLALWDWTTKIVTELDSGKRWGTTLFVNALHAGGALLVHNAYSDGCATAILTTAPEVPVWERCDLVMVSVAVSADGSRVAVAETVEGGDALHVLDAATGETLQSWILPSGNTEPHVVWEDAQRVLFTMVHAYKGGSATALIRCTVGASACERVPTPQGEDITAPGSPVATRGPLRAS